MQHQIRKNLTPIAILTSIAFGFLLQDIGSALQPYITFLLMLLMFFVTLNIDQGELVRSFRNQRILFLTLFMVFVFTPSIGLAGSAFFSPITYAGIILALCAPSAIATAFWATVFKGDAPLGLVISVTSNLLSIITIPATMFVTIGRAVNVDVGWMVLNLAELILVPMTLAFLVRRFLHTNSAPLVTFSSRVQLLIMFLLIWGSISVGAAYAKVNIIEFAWLNLFMFIVLCVSFGTARIIGRWFGREQAITIGIATCVKNAALPLVIGMTFFGSQIMPPLIANLIEQNLLMAPLRILERRE